MQYDQPHVPEAAAGDPLEAGREVHQAPLVISTFVQLDSSVASA
jgi:hypothetical protein